MKIILPILFSMIFFVGNAQINSENEEPFFSEKEHKSLKKDSKLLEKIKFSKAVKKFGKPDESREIKVTEETISIFLPEESIEKHFPNKEYLNEEFHLFEASWKRFSEYWITVMYKFEKDEWVPISILVTL